MTAWGAVCNVMLAALKFVAGIIGHSAAMMAGPALSELTDASLSDELQVPLHVEPSVDSK